MEHIRKYRGKSRQSEEWVYGCFLKSKSYCCILQQEENIHENNFPYLDKDSGIIDGSLTPVFFESVGQSSMVKDKNEVEMYEGDIVYGAAYWLERCKPAVVTFRNGSFGLLWYRGDVEEFDPFTSLCNVEYEVVGDIYDNHELMEG